MKFSCVIPSLNPRREWIQQTLYSCEIFDEVLVNIERTQDIDDLSYVEKTENLLKLCKGDWISIISDDDWFCIEGLKQAIDYAKTTDADIICTPFYQVEENKLYRTGDRNIDDSIFKENFLNPSNLFRRKVWEDIHFTGEYAQDWLFWLKAYIKKYNFKYIDIPTYNHRVRKNSLCRRQYAKFGNNFNNFREYILTEANK